MATDRSPTTFTVPVLVRRALAKCKTPGKTYGDEILELIEEYPTEAFLQEMDRRSREEPRVSLSEFRTRRAY